MDNIKDENGEPCIINFLKNAISKDFKIEFWCGIAGDGWCYKEEERILIVDFHNLLSPCLDYLMLHELLHLGCMPGDGEEEKIVNVKRRISLRGKSAYTFTSTTLLRDLAMAG